MSMLTWFWALPHFILADGIALNFAGPLFAAPGAVVLLDEHVAWRRWVAMLIGFAGVLAILRPGF